MRAAERRLRRGERSEPQGAVDGGRHVAAATVERRSPDLPVPGQGSLPEDRLWTKDIWYIRRSESVSLFSNGERESDQGAVEWVCSRR